MTYTVPIRRLLALRDQVSDRQLLDFLDLITMAREPGFVATSDLRDRWRCSQSAVSRRIARLVNAGLIDCTTIHGGYQVHAMREVAA